MTAMERIELGVDANAAALGGSAHAFELAGPRDANLVRGACRVAATAVRGVDLGVDALVPALGSAAETEQATLPLRADLARSAGIVASAAMRCVVEYVYA